METSARVKQQLNAVANWYSHAGLKDLERAVVTLEREVTESVTIIGSCKAMQCLRLAVLSRSFETSRNFCSCQKLSPLAT